MTTVTIADVRKDLAEVINQTAYGKNRTVITRRGKALVAVVPIEDLQLLEALEQEIHLREARVALAEADQVGAVPLADVISRMKAKNP